MRHAPTASEAALWRRLRGRAGSACSLAARSWLAASSWTSWLRRRRLIVAVDGGWHSGRDAADARRDAALGRVGYRVLRLPAELVEREVEVAVARVRDALGGA